MLYKHRRLFETKPPSTNTQDMFYTERLCFRGFTDDDKDKVVGMVTDPRIAPNFTRRFRRPAKPDLGDNLKQHFLSSIWAAVVVTREGNDFVGILTLGMPPDTPNRNGELAICIAPDHWSKGYGGEMLKLLLSHAFMELGLNKVWLEVVDDNTSAISLYKKW